MMIHKEIERLIQKRLDGKTTVEEEHEILLHLSLCAECQQFYQELVQITDAVGGVIEFFPSHNFNERVLKKLGIKKSSPWPKVATAFAGAWLGSLLFLLFSPLTKILLGKGLTSIPAFMHLLNKIVLALTSLGHFIMPFVEKSFKSPATAIGLIFTVFIIYFFGRMLKKEAKCSSS